MTGEPGAPSRADDLIVGPQHPDIHADEVSLPSEVWTGDFPEDFTAEELYLMLEIAPLFPSEREFVALLGGDAAQVWDIERDEDASDPAPSLEERTAASVFERLRLPAPSRSVAPRKKKK